jgi:hypothetical protein
MLKTLAPFVTLWLSGIALVAGGGQRADAVAHGTADLVGRTPPAAQGVAPAARSTASDDAAFLNRYCVACHNQRVKTANLELDTMSLDDVGAHGERWEKVVRKLRTGMMPPMGAPRPGREVIDGFTSELEARLDRVAKPDASLTTPALHRLNRTEYANAIRDLLAVEIDVESLLPPDGASEGFDNIAAALGVSPSLIQGYVSAALKISRQAIGDRTLAPSQITYTTPPALSQDRHIEGLPLGTRGGMLIRHTFPLDAEYDFALGGGAGGGGAGGAAIDVTLNGQRLEVENPRRFRLQVSAGPHTIGVAVVDRQRGAGVNEIYSDFRTNAAFSAAGGVQSLTITGPFNQTGVGDTPSRRRVLVCQPSGVSDEEPCARQILSTVARRAYRGPVSDAEVDTLIQFFRQGRDEGDFEIGIQHALARILVAPRFVYRAEAEPEGVAAGSIYRINDFDLASRLSFFLWSSIPDDELLDLATRGRLGSAETLRQQVTRMLADPRSDALITNFAGQWLYLRELEGVQSEAATFDDNLRRSFRRETELLFASIVREDRSLIELLDADYTFVDERLARHYGIPDVFGSHFRRVALGPDNVRRGLLGHGSLLTVTSVATRTSPVMRGQWILENLLGMPAPEPPPGVETNLDEDVGTVGGSTTLRQRLEMHRSNPVCASCHNLMDPIGFALENFDLVGAWREYDGKAPIDASGQLADGTPLAGPAELRQALLSRSDAFMTTVTEKLLTYGLGRGIHYDDMPMVRAIARSAARNENRFSSLVLGIVESDAFQMRITR